MGHLFQITLLLCPYSTQRPKAKQKTAQLKTETWLQYKWIKETSWFSMFEKLCLKMYFNIMLFKIGQDKLSNLFQF